IVVTVASWIGLTVSAQRDGSPNRSCSRFASAAEYLRRCGSMRIWQRSAMAWIRTPDRSVIVSWNVSVGVAAHRSAAAPVQPNIRSVISVLRVLAGPLGLQCRGPLAYPGQERRERGADLSAAVKALLAQPQLTHERVAHVDRDQEYLVA